jgi:glycerol-3-phosphate acyltransferase PlsY
LFTGQDIRTVGSGSTGATNVKRVMGKKWFFIVMLLDALKGALPVVLAYFFADAYREIGLLPVIAAVFAIVGHSKSVFLKFTGGKSVASGVGTLLALNWQAGIIIAVVWAIITWFSRYVSLGSIIALALAPVIMWVLKSPLAYVIYAFIAAVYVIYLHRENIKRLLAGNENKVR